MLKTSNILLLVIMIFPLVFLAGCSDSEQLHQKLVIQGIGIDSEGSGYRVTVQAFGFQNLKSEDEPGIRLIELRGNTVMEALSGISLRTGLNPLYSQNLLLVIGSKTAAKGVRGFIDFFIRYYEARPTVKICVSKVEAYEILGLNNSGKLVSAKEIQALIRDDIKSDILHFVGDMENNLSDPVTACLNIETEGSNKYIVSDGLAIFSGDRVIDFMDGNNTLGVLLLRGVSDLGVYNIETENSAKASCRIEKVSTKIGTFVDENVRRFNIQINIEAGLYELEGGFGPKGPGAFRRDLENKLSGSLETVCREACRSSVNINTDIFHLGKILLNSRPSYFKSIENSWKGSIKGSDFNINVHAFLPVTGTELSS